MSEYEHVIKYPWLGWNVGDIVSRGKEDGVSESWHQHAKQMTLSLVTYGCGDRLDLDQFQDIQHGHQSWINKPSGGLWASPIGSHYGWREWCLENDWGVESLCESFEFEMRGKVYVIDTVEDLARLPRSFDTGSSSYVKNYIDWDQIRGVDAIWLTERGQGATRHSDPDLYGWDCECVLVLNPEAVSPLQQECSERTAQQETAQ